MLVKGDPGLLNSLIMMKFRCNIYLSIQNMCSFYSFQNISIPFTILSDVFINYWLIYIVIKVKYKKCYELIPSAFVISEHHSFYTLVQTCWLYIKSSGSHLATAFFPHMV